MSVDAVGQPGGTTVALGDSPGLASRFCYGLALFQQRPGAALVTQHLTVLGMRDRSAYVGRLKPHQPLQSWPAPTGSCRTGSKACSTGTTLPGLVQQALLRSPLIP
ncbi:MAG TPA: hypothetical protein EYP04_03860 [Anaerolineae bacterium]|nr:hypothetical protein [Anaerolineae bacterium]